MTPAQIGPSAWESPEPSDSPAGSRAFENSPFTQILEAVPYGLFVLAASGTAVYANLRAREILGKGIPDDATASNLAEAYSAYLAGTNTLYPTERMPIVRALSGETSTVSDMEIRLPDGSERTFDHPVTVAEVAASIGAGLARAALAGRRLYR